MGSPVNVNVNAGFLQGPAYWTPVLNILFVIDGRINTSKDPNGFGLGYVLETLRTLGSSLGAALNVVVVRHDNGVYLPTSSDPPMGDDNYTAAGSGPPPQFTFSRDLDAWDQVWLFGDYPANLDADIQDSSMFPTVDSELRWLADWMDRGGGVFAAGDHWDLGASLCSRIPRVRTMRRWTPDQGVPPMDGGARLQTLQPSPTTQNQDFLEGDTIPQHIEVVYRLLTISDLIRPAVPHPLLATSTGIIETFPDHMHEGEVILDDEVELDLPTGIQGYFGLEYPLPTDPTMPRPRPHVAAYGRTTNRAAPDTLASASAVVDTGSTLLTKRFGLISTYDGDSIGVGRVIVESTWHHWFSYNLHGFAAASPDTQYQLMQTYYRNVAVWLSTPAQRQSMLSAAIWNVVVSDPMAFPVAPARTLWAVGERVVGVISRKLSKSMLLDLVGAFFNGRAHQIFGVPNNQDPSAPYAGSVSADLALRAIIGGIASSFIEPVYDYLGRGPRRLLDREAIAEHAAEGVKLGLRALTDAIQSSAGTAKGVVDQLKSAFKPSPPQVPIALIGMRVVAERLQFPDPTDPVLAKGPFTITLRVSLGNVVILNEVIDHIEVPSFHPAGGILELDRILYDGLVQSGEMFVVEVIAGTAGSGQVDAERLRFTDTLNSDPRSWIGEQAPSRNQLWRLWYRIEKSSISMSARPVIAN
jgi:hypothetical protein